MYLHAFKCCLGLIGVNVGFHSKYVKLNNALSLIFAFILTGEPDIFVSFKKLKNNNDAKKICQLIISEFLEKFQSEKNITDVLCCQTTLFSNYNSST